VIKPIGHTNRNYVLQIQPQIKRTGLYQFKEKYQPKTKIQSSI